VYKTYLPDNFQGIPRSIWEIAQATHAHGVTAEVLSLSPSPTPAAVVVGDHVSRRVRQDVFLASTALSISAFAEFRRLAASADLVHYHFPWPLMDLLHFSAPRRPSVVTYHSDIVRQKWLRRAYRPLMQRFLGDVSRIVATSPNYRDTSPVLRRYRDKVEVIPLGLSERPPDDPALLARLRQQLPDRFLLFVGAFRYYKGLNYLIDAAARTGIQIVLAGVGQLPPAETQKIDNLHILGAVGDDEREALLSLCAGFVFPSHLRSEAFGIALLEAARAGRPLISCEIGTGTSFVNVDGQTGHVVPPADAGALAAAMARLLDNPAEAARMGNAARQRYEQLFTAATMGRDYANLYQRVFSASGRR
jgi:rhamnosyl/mannosyltransferase